MKKPLILFFIILLFSKNLNAQYSWETVSLPTGGYIYSILGIDSTSLVCGNYNGIFLSTNQGQDWIRDLPSNQLMNVIKFRRDSSGNIYAGGSGILKINNNDIGKPDNWNYINIGPANGVGFNDFLVTPSGNIYIATNSRSIFFSNDQGVSWSHKDAGLTDHNISELLLMPNGFLLASTDSGIFISKDEGNTWTNCNLNSTLSTSLANSITGKLYVADRDLYCSVDTGQTWQLVVPDVYSTDVAVNDSGQIFIGSNGKILRSYDDGTTWAELKNGLANVEITDLDFGPNNKIYAGTRFGVYISSDNGQNWKDSNIGLSNVYIENFARANDSTVFVGTDNGIFRSRDKGYTWERTNYNSWSSVAIGLKNELWACTALLRSFDEGESFQSNSSIENRDFKTDSLTGRYYLATPHGIKVSSDSGSVWSSFDPSLDTIMFSQIMCTKNNIQYAARVNWSYVGNGYDTNSGGDIYKLKGDSIVRWEKLGSVGMMVFTMISVDSNTFYAGGTKGVFLSQDAGKTWTSLGLGFTRTLSFDGKNIIAGTWDGCYYLPLQQKSPNKSEMSIQNSNWILTIKDNVQGLLTLSDHSICAGGTAGRIYKGTSSASPYLEPDSTIISFGKVLQYKTVSRTLILNSYNSDVKIDSISIENKAFQIPHATFPLIIKSGSSLQLLVSFTPNSISSYTGLVKIYSNSSDSLLKISLNGCGIDISNGITDNEVTTNGFKLQQNYPNPFNSETNIDFVVSEPSIVTIKVFNTMGIEIATLVNTHLIPGKYSYNWNVASLPNGVYFYNMTAKSLNIKLKCIFTQTNKLILKK